MGEILGLIVLAGLMGASVPIACGGAEEGRAADPAAPRALAESQPVFLQQAISGGTVSFDPPALGQLVCLVDPTRSRSPGFRRLQLEIPIQNVSEQPLRLSVQVEFLDAECAAYGDRTARRVLMLAPGETRSVHVTSAKERASEFAVRVWHLP